MLPTDTAKAKLMTQLIQQNIPYALGRAAIHLTGTNIAIIVYASVKYPKDYEAYQKKGIQPLFLHIGEITSGNAIRRIRYYLDRFAARAGGPSIPTHQPSIQGSVKASQGAVLQQIGNGCPNKLKQHGWFVRF